MLKRYWIIVFAFGLVWLPVQPQHSWSQEQKIPQHAQIDIPLPDFGLFENSDESNGLYQPCEQGEENRNSNLCAQWKAADAAKKSADWAVNTFWLGIYGAIIGTFTLAAAGAAAFYAKKAAEHTERGADAAEEAVEETRRMGMVQTRAYMSFDHYECKTGIKDDGSVGGFRFLVHVKNTGQSPAYIRNFFTFIACVSPDEDIPDVIVPDEESIVDSEIGGNSLGQMWPFDLDIDTARKIYFEELACYFVGYGSYWDVFQTEKDARHEFRFCHRLIFKVPPEHALGTEFLFETPIITKYRIGPKEN